MIDYLIFDLKKLILIDLELYFKIYEFSNFNGFFLEFFWFFKFILDLF